MGFMDEYNKLKKKRLEEQSSATSEVSNSSSFMDEYNKLKSKRVGTKKEDIGASLYDENRYSPTLMRVADRMTTKAEKPWYESGQFEDGYDFGDVTKTILGISDKKKEVKTFTAPETEETLESLREKIAYYDSRKWNNEDQQRERTRLVQLYDQLALAQYSDTLSKTQMDGQNHTVLEEIEILANMKSGDEKDKRKEAVLNKMEELGMEKDFYAHFAGDGEFDLGTFGNWLKTGIGLGLNSFNKGLLDTADVLLGAPLKAMGWEDNPISEGAEYYDYLYSAYRYDAEKYKEKLGGGAWGFATDAVEGTVGAVPNALLMFMPGGQSAAPTTSSLVTQATMRAGNLLTKAGLTVEAMLKNPHYWMSFARTLGSDYKQAKELGASDTAAAVGSVLTSMLNAGVEIGPDGGSGIQGLPQGLKEGGKPFWEWVESWVEEGGEEILQKFIGEAVNKVGYGSDEEILNPMEYAKEGILGMISGMALGGAQVAVQSGANAVAEHQANKLTAVEKSVADKIIQNRIAEKEKDGKTLSSKDKSDIKKEVERLLRKGFLSAEEIEEAIGGKSYEAFKTARDSFFGSAEYQNYRNSQKADQKRLSELEKQLEKLAGEPNTVGNAKKYEAVQHRIENLKKRMETSQAKLTPEATRVMGLRNQMRSEMMGALKDTRFAESYRELERRNQRFDVDISKYTNEYARKTVQSILDSKLGDNTRQFHDTIDWLAKLSEEKGVTFDFTNNKRLKGTKHYKEGYWTNGFVNDNGDITLNLDSPRALNTTVGHEITHVLEKAGIYTELSKAVRDYAIAKEGVEGYNKRVTDIKEIYGNNQTKIDSELTADIIGEYLFTDYEFVHNLSTQNRNVFEKIYDEIKYLYKIATAGSKEARELEKVKKMFDKAWRENIKGNTDSDTDAEGNVDGIQYSVTVEDKETLDSLNEELQKGEVTKVYRAMQVQPVDENGEVIKATVMRVVSQSPLMVEAKTFGKDGKVDVYPAKLFSPMAGMVNGKWSNNIELNKWEKTTYDFANAYTVIDEKTGQPKIDTTKKNASYGEVAYFYGLVKGGIDDSGKPLTNIPARYNPYIHTSLSALNDQFSSANKRPELVTVECIIPNSELTSGFRAEGAKDRVGAMSWHSGPTSSRLAKVGKARTVILTRYDMPVRVLPDSEVAQAVADYIGDSENIAIKGSTVTPSLSQELMNLGISVLNDEQWSQYDKDFPTKTFGKQKKTDALGKKILDTKSIQHSYSAIPSHKKSLEKNFDFDNASLDLETITQRYDKIIGIWEKLGGELDSKFLNDWNNKVERPFTIFKAQSGYKYNVELSSMCKKGVPLFEAIDTIVKKEVMKELDMKVMGKEEKEILYDILKQKHFEIPCAICYVEQARQREGVVIDAFLNGKTTPGKKGTTDVKLGWNQVLDSIQKEMKANGVDYTFNFVSRDIATDKYIPAESNMDEQTYAAFAEAVKKVANEEITRYNQANGKKRPLLKDVTPEAVKECFKGGLPSNLKIFKVLLTEPSSRFKIQNDLLYSSMTTKNLTMAHNGLYSLFNSQGGVSGYKTKQAPTVYWGEILGKKWKPEATRKEGGIRNQSNSDFQMYTLLDQAQMYMDFSAKGYYLQAYTKVLSELKLFGLSRGKINASLIPQVKVYRNADGTVDVEKTMENAGLDENGNPIYDDIEGINHTEAFMLLEDPEYSKNIGGICIGYSDNHIRKLLDDSRVQLIIGFHDKTNDPNKRYRGARYAKNYNGLNEATKQKADGTSETVHIGFNPFIKKAEQKFQFNKDTETFEGTVTYKGKTYTADDIPRLATDLYLEHCAKKNLTPAYNEFHTHQNYYKLLADFSLYDSEGHYAPHQKVAYNMPDSVPYLDADGNKQYMSSEEYIKTELQKELAVRDSLIDALADDSEDGIIPRFKAEVEKRNAPTQYSMTKAVPLDQRLSGDALLDAEDLISEIEDVADIDSNGYVTVYHRTTEDNAKRIMVTRKMSAKEDGIFFSTQMDGANSTGYGKGVVKLRVPIEKFVLDDIFDDEAHLRIPLKNRRDVLDISEYIDSDSTQYSMTKDSAGRELSAEQQEFFKDSKVVDESGSLKVMYHGTSRGGFNIFDIYKSKYGLFGTGFYFTDSENIGNSYTKKGKGNNPKVYESYLNITNPLDMDAIAIPTQWEEAFDDVDFPESGTNEEFYRAVEEYYADQQIAKWEVEDIIRESIEYGMGYDGITHIGGGRVNADGERHRVYIAFEPEQIKNVDNIAPTDHPDIRYSVSKEEKAKMDSDYFAAIESGDEEIQRHLVREFAKASMPDSKLVDEEGNLREVYHGTNTGDFTVFNPDYIGMSSGDDGFFGMGFYFAYSKGEASYYGAKRIIPAYLNLTNPFNFERELHTYNGKRARYGHAPDAVALMNFADKFPDIAMSITLGAVKNGESTGKSISVFEFAKAFKDVIENKEFDYQEVVNEFGETETLVTADPQVHEYEYNGETHSWRDFGFQKRFMYGHDILDVAYEYLSNAVYSYIDIPRFTRIVLDNNKEFTAELKNRGYDGTIQSEHGDEAVAFYPNQIKSAAPITRDADGNVIPLSKRFDSEQDDIRYSMSRASELENAYQYDLDNDDLLGAELVVEQMANLAMPDSKIRDKKGNLIPVYHGTNAMFWEFDTSADGGKNGTAEGFGIYLSDDQEVTNAYGDRQIKMFANITKPATSFKKTIKASTLVKLIKQTCERQAKQMVDEEGYDSIRDAIRDTWVSNYVDTYSSSMEQAYREVANSMIQQNDNDKDIIHEVMFGMAIRSYDQAMDFYKNSLTPVTGIDGFITKWENASTGSSSNIYLAFDSSQLKSAEAVTRDETGNVIPLSERFNFDKKDIRYSISKDGGDTSGDWHIDGNQFGKGDEFDDFAPIRKDIPGIESKAKQTQTAPKVEPAPTAPETETVVEEHPIQPPKEKVTENLTPMQQKIRQKIANTEAELEKNRQLKAQSLKEYDEEISRLQAEYDSKADKKTMTAQNILRRIERLKRIKGNIDADYTKRIADLEKRVEKMHSEEYSRAEHRRAKQEGYTKMWEDLIGDTSTWKDMALGLQYKTKTLRRILRKVVKDGNGNPDFHKADAIYDKLETKYDRNEALLKKESKRLKEVFFNLKMNHEEDTYAHMLGELRHNPDTTLTEDVVKEYYNKHKGKIDEQKVNTAIKEARKTFDDLIVRVNEVLREQGFKEIPYRHGYFPHFTNPKQGWLAKLLNWKTIDTEIPTSIAGLTEAFKPQRSWQSFNKQRMGDKTDYSLSQGLDTYIHGALDWIYHIEDLQERRSLENYLRYTHSEEGVKERIDEIKKGNYDAEEAQQMIDAVLSEASNPLSGLVRELMNRTNTLANKKSSMDRGMEDALNRKIYSTMTNLNNRITANQVVGSLSSAMTNFIPMVQSWHQVSPYFTVRGLGDFIRSTIKDDGMVSKSTFLTNRLMEEEKLYQTFWDKASDKAAFMMNVADNITSQTVWRSKYLQNLKEGMSESHAIMDADQFAKNLLAGRSRGNAPTIFDAKNPRVKIFTAFQLEVANQYGYMFEDTPQDTKNKLRLVKGYATAFLGAYMYNSLYSSLVGRDAALDPIAIFEDLLKGLFDDEEEPEEALLGFGEDIIEQMPFVGGLMGGGRIPLSSAFPYSGYSTPVRSFLADVDKAWNEGNPAEGEWSSLSKELLKPLYYLAMPVGGGQIKKTVEGLSMFSDDHPIAGSYTASGNLRFPVEDTLGSRIQAGLFGQYASENARYYFDNDIAPLKEEQIQEYKDVDIPIRDYWDYREGLAEHDKWYDKADYIANLDLPIDKKNILINNISTSKEPIDLRGYERFGNYDEFNFAKENPGKYEFLKEQGISVKQYKDFSEEQKNAYTWAFKNPEAFTMSKAVTSDIVQYKRYTSALWNFEADKDKNGKTISGSKKKKVREYINNLNISYGAKLVLFKSQYTADDTHNMEIVQYVNSLDMTFNEKATTLRELGFKVDSKGNVYWD